MSKFTLTIDGNEATLDFGDETQADGSMIHAQLPISVTHLRVKGHKVTRLGEHVLDGINWGNGFLEGCKNLTSVDLSSLNNVTQIGDDFLRNCTSFTSVDLTPFKNVTYIGDGFLSWCLNLKEIDLSPLSNVTKIGFGFLSWCENLRQVDFSPLDNVTEFGKGFLLGSKNIQWAADK